MRVVVAGVGAMPWWAYWRMPVFWRITPWFSRRILPPGGRSMLVGSSRIERMSTRILFRRSVLRRASPIEECFEGTSIADSSSLSSETSPNLERVDFFAGTLRSNVKYFPPSSELALFKQASNWLVLRVFLCIEFLESRIQFGRLLRRVTEKSIE